MWFGLRQCINADEIILPHRVRGWLEPILLDQARQLTTQPNLLGHESFRREVRSFARETRYCSTGFLGRRRCTGLMSPFLALAWSACPPRCIFRRAGAMWR